MKRDERIAHQYLRSLSLGEVVYQPDGNIPPDFLVDGRIAVEVRRLNKHYNAGDELRSLEQDAAPLVQGMLRLLAEFQNSELQETWFVMMNFRRPLPAWRELRRRVRSELKQFLLAPLNSERVQIAENFSITLVAATEAQNRAFILGGFLDGDAGGWVVSEIMSNLSVYMPEKTRKVAPYRTRYRTWWLLFVDHIGTPSEATEVQQYIKRPSDWDRVIILHRDGKHAYDI